MIGKWDNISFKTKRYREQSVHRSCDCKEKRKMESNELRNLRKRALNELWWSESVVPRKITWKTLEKTEPIQIQFLIRSTYNLLLTARNLMRFGKMDDTICGPGHIKHILSSCIISLAVPWYCPKKIAHDLKPKRVNANKTETKAAKKKELRLLKAGQISCKINGTKIENKSLVH